MSQELDRTERTSLKRLPKRGVYDREVIYGILDEAFICHVGFVVDGQPFVIPTGYARVGDNLLIHGSAASRMLRALAREIEVCVTVTLIDGLVLARSAFHHSVNYRSVLVFGKAAVVRDEQEKLKALEAFTEHIIQGRWQEVRWPHQNELRATTVLSLPLKEASAKIRTGPPIDDEEDYELSVWAGEIPLQLASGEPVRDPRLPAQIALPSHVLNYTRSSKSEQHDTGISIRNALPDDAEQIASILLESFAEYESSYTQAGYAATTPTSEQLQSRFSEGPTWVAFLKDAMVGTVSAIQKGEDLYVRSMAVLPAARGHRIGELLLKHVENFATTNGHKRLVLSTTPFLARAIRLYENSGFRHTNEPPHELFGTPLLTMVKTLDIYS